MCHRPFVHIHNHTEYSLLDGANRIPEMVAKAKEFGNPALAITDHGVMFGAMEFYFECLKQGIKPIIGFEAYVAPGGLHNKRGREDSDNFHLLLLARNLEGYRNLCKLHSVAALEGFYYKPRIDHDLLRENAKGIIGTSACLGSEICQALMAGQFEKAKDTAAMYREIFDDGCFMIELQDHRIPEQAEIRDDLVRIARELKLPLVASNDAHYLCKESSAAHDALLCIGIGELVANPKKAPRFSTDEFYIKSPAEMEALFRDLPEALENTLMVADMVDLELGKSRAPMPEPEVPEGLTVKSYLRDLSEKGLKDRIAKLDDNAWERLNYELEVIEKTGFEDYFLLVREFANFTRNNGIAFGVRGSAAGSLVSYCIGITDVDPLEYDLTFERFLNIERISMPDIDMDFEDARRDEVIKYVTERFGKEQVAQIITFGTLGAKAAIKDAGRVLGYSPADTDKICKLLPNRPGISLRGSLHDAKRDDDEKARRDSADTVEFRQLYNNDPNVQNIVDTALSIEGLSRHAGVHAAGVVISKDPLQEYIPLYRGNENQPITGFEMGILEKIGLLKMDFLGLSNLTVLARAVDNIRRTHKGKSPIEHPILERPVNELPLDDPKVYELLGRGDTVGVFQLESGGMRRNITELKPENVRELAAMVALYRPGPMEHIPTFINNKFGRSQPSYLAEQMRPILEETYGIIVYQDQVLKLVQALAGFTLGKADILRRAMGKKDKKALDSMKVEFVEGAGERGVAADAAEQIWTLLEPFAGYAFNKAHAVCYSLVSYQTAYLKANYPTEYMAALLEVYRDREDKVVTFIEECRRMKIAVLPPDINRSQVGFTIEDQLPKGYTGAIRFGLAAIKGVGEGLVEGMIEERSNGPFTHLYEFAERTKESGMNRSALEALVRAGALDSIDRNRQKLLNTIDGAISYADHAIRTRQAGQDSLFGEASEVILELPVLPDVPAASRSDLLSWEKQVMGIYVSDHPLRGLERALRRVVTHSCGNFSELSDGTRVQMAGVITAVKSRPTKDGGKRLQITLEDFSGPAPCTLGQNMVDKVGHLVEKDKVVQVKGVVSQFQMRSGETLTEVRITELAEFQAPLETEDPDDQSEGTVVITIGAAKEEGIAELKRLIARHPGGYRVLIELDLEGNMVPMELLHKVDGSDVFLQAARRCLAKGNVEKIDSGRILMDAPEPEAASA